MGIEQISEERRAVIENMRSALLEGDTFRKVELSDPTVSEGDIKRVIVPFDNMRTRPLSRIKAFAARLMAEKFTRAVNSETEIRGMENAKSVTGGAIVTSNHYNPTDSTPPRLVAYECGKRKKLHIVVQQTNIFMTGLFGFLMKNCNTHPVSPNAEYMVKNLRPSLEHFLAGGSFVLIYPEQEMWFNYKKPRALREGAYHYAALFGVPIIPTFTEMITLPGERDENGFLPVKHILHIMPPIYPDKNLSVRENRRIMLEADREAKRRKYEEVYGIPLDGDFIPERDIAGV